MCILCLPPPCAARAKQAIVPHGITDTGAQCQAVASKLSPRMPIPSPSVG